MRSVDYLVNLAQFEKFEAKKQQFRWVTVFILILEGTSVYLYLLKVFRSVVVLDSSKSEVKSLQKSVNVTSRSEESVLVVF